jgi:hypothetical protein
MNELGRESLALIGAARHGERLHPDDKARIRGKIAQRIGAGVALGSALTAGATAAKAAQLSMLGGLAAWLPISAKVMGIVIVSTAVGVATIRVARPRAPTVPTAANAVHQAAAVPRADAPANSKREQTLALPEVLPEPTPRPEPVSPLPDRARLRAGAPIGTREARNASLPANPLDVETSARPPDPANDVLARQVAAIRESRAAIRRGDAQAALAALDRTAIEGQSGPLEQEAMLARVSALCLQGNVVAARGLSERFLTRFPDSLLVQRIRSSCAFEPNDAK